MTQQQYTPPGQPGYPPQPAQQGGPPEWAQPGGWIPPGQPQQNFAQQQYQQYAQPPQPPQAPQQPLAQGNLDDFFNQRSSGSGPGLSWKDKQIGYWYVGVVARDVGNGDVEQQTDMSSGQPKFFKDGSPMFQLKVPVKQIQPADGNLAPFPEGEGTWYVKGQARDELTRAMAEAGCTYPVPKAGDSFTVQLVQRRKAGNYEVNVVQIRYTPAQHNLGGQQAPVAGAPSPAPAPSQAAPPMAQLQQPVQPQVPASAQTQYQQPQVQQYAPPAPPQGQAPAQPPAAPQGAQGAPVPPPPVDPQAQAILAQITGQPV